MSGGAGALERAAGGFQNVCAAAVGGGTAVVVVEAEAGVLAMAG